MKLKITIFFLISLIFVACSSSQETTQNENGSNEPEIYVFDDVADEAVDTTAVVEEEPVETEDANVVNYFVQVGAFTTRERAESFVAEHSSKLDFPMSITYSDEVKLFVVQLPPFDTRSAAEDVRNKLWQTEVFNDAFILSK